MNEIFISFVAFCIGYLIGLFIWSIILFIIDKCNIKELFIHFIVVCITFIIFILFKGVR
jgi:hypothetical protein